MVLTVTTNDEHLEFAVRDTGIGRKTRAATSSAHERNAVNKPAIRIGIGIASGDVVAGYTGTQ